MREELNALRQTEVEMEQAVDLEKGQLDTLNKNLVESMSQIDQVSHHLGSKGLLEFPMCGIS